jgi:hypothetical protein
VLCSASPACLDSGLLALCFLPRVASLAVELDIPPALPSALADLPTTLQSLSLAGMWLAAVPHQLTECAGAWASRVR